MRPLFLMFEDDEGAYKEEYQYLYGDDLLVAPASEPGNSDWEVYLPGPESWIFLWDSTESQLTGGQTVTVPAPIGQPPVFYRASSKWSPLFAEIRENYKLN